MTVDFNCQRCDGSFEMEYGDLLEGEKLQCPNCDQPAPAKVVEELVSALDELMARVAELRGKFQVSVTIESDDLPASYGEAEDDEDDDDDEEDDDEGGDEDTDDEDAPEEEDEDER